MNIAGELLILRMPCRAVGKMDIVVINEGFGHGDERDIAGETTIVEPVVADRGDAIDEASGVHRDNDEV